jgi:hypothetical protein
MTEEKKRDDMVKIEYKPGNEMVITIKSPFGKIIPDQAQKEFAAARTEFLTAVRDTLSKYLASCPPVEKKAQAAARNRKIKVE